MSNPTEDQDLQEMMTVSPAAVVRAQTEGEVDVQIATAKEYPRSLKAARDMVVEMACSDRATAESCFYALPRGGKLITGDSVRLAEIFVAAYGNIRAGARIISIEEVFLTAQGVCHDLQQNVYYSTEVKRRITNAYGKRYSDDMVMVTANAACKIAFRNAVFGVIPRSLFLAQIEKIKKVSLGKAETLVERREVMVNWFAERGITPEQLCAGVEVPALDDMGLEEVAKLRRIANAMQDGTLSAADFFPSEEGLGDRLSQGTHEFAPQDKAPKAAPQNGDRSGGSTEREGDTSDTRSEGEAVDSDEATEAAPESESEGTQSLRTQAAEALAQSLGVEKARPTRILTTLGITSTGELQDALASRTDEMMEMDGIGKTSIDALHNALQRHYNKLAEQDEGLHGAEPEPEPEPEAEPQAPEEEAEPEPVAESTEEDVGGDTTPPEELPEPPEKPLLALDKEMTRAPKLFGAACREHDVEPLALNALDEIPEEKRILIWQRIQALRAEQGE